MMMARALVVGVVLTLGVATEARAQWEVPSFLPPRPGEDIGLYLTDAGDFGIQGIWRQHGNLNLGLRLGYIDYPADGAIILGFETWGGLYSAAADFPVDVSWTLGAGAAFNGATIVSIPLGLSIGRTFDLQALPIQVYGHPRLALVIASAGNETDADLDGMFDLGADFMFSPNWTLRVGVTLGEFDALGIGLAYRFGRTAVVR